MRRHLILSLFLGFLTLALDAQDFKKRDIRILQRLQIDTAKYDLSDARIRWNMESIVHAHRRANLNQGFAIGFTTVGALNIISGAIILSATSNSGTLGNELARVMGTISVAGGIAYGAVSIPFWLGAKKNRSLTYEQRAKLP